MLNLRNYGLLELCNKIEKNILIINSENIILKSWANLLLKA